MTFLLIASICLNFYLFALYKQQAEGLKSLGQINGRSQGIISKLTKESEANNERSRSLKRRKSRVLQTATIIN
jgi:hypothetical protein